ncbi:MAG: PIG-L deacetylase family protein, partial [Pyrinomonadaceae bacterium]
MYLKKYRKNAASSPLPMALRITLWTVVVLSLLTSGLPLRNNNLITGANAQIKSDYNRGAVELSLLLRRLQTTASVLHTGAHPDDENSALLAKLARGNAIRVAYLSLTRGEGGQNIIGPDLFEALGVIRTEELLQARALDGAEQLFTRAVDFGYTTSRTETAEKWGEKEVLGDVVRAIRTFRPLIIIARFSGTPSDGHGHHQMAGYLTPLAFRAAADPLQFPEQLSEGLHRWQALKLYLNEGFGTTTGNVRVNTGDYDPLIGRTYFEIAMEGRSQHKTQEMGAPEMKGPQSTGMRLIESRIQTDSSLALSSSGLFDGIDTSLPGIATLYGIKDSTVIDALKQAQESAAQALADYNVFAPEKLISPLITGLRGVRDARNQLVNSAIEAQARDAADFLLEIKEQEFTRCLQLAAGVDVDVLTDSETITPGEQIGIAIRLFNNALANSNTVVV